MSQDHSQYQGITHRQEETMTKKQLREFTALAYEEARLRAQYLANKNTISEKAYTQLWEYIRPETQEGYMHMVKWIIKNAP